MTMLALGALAALVLLVIAVFRAGTELRRIADYSHDHLTPLMLLAERTGQCIALFEQIRKEAGKPPSLEADRVADVVRRLEDLCARFFSMLMPDERHLDEHWESTNDLALGDGCGKMSIVFRNPASSQEIRVILSDPESGGLIELKSCEVQSYIGGHKDHAPEQGESCGKMFGPKELPDVAHLLAEFILAYPRGYRAPAPTVPWDLPRTDQEEADREFSNLGAPEPGDDDYEAAVDQTLTGMNSPATGDETVRGDIGEETVRFVPQRNPFEPDVKATDNALNGAARIRPLKQHPSFEDGV